MSFAFETLVSNPFTSFSHWFQYFNISNKNTMFCFSLIMFHQLDHRLLLKIRNFCNGLKSWTNGKLKMKFTWSENCSFLTLGLNLLKVSSGYSSCSLIKRVCFKFFKKCLISSPDWLVKRWRKTIVPLAAITKVGRAEELIITTILLILW